MISLGEHRRIVARLSKAGKSNRGAGGYSRWVNRPLGRHLAALGFALKLTPNQISLLSAACTFTAIGLFASLHPALVTAVVVTVLLVLGYALDSADGQVARLRGGGSSAGEWLDHVLDAVKISTFHLAVAVSWYRFYDLRHPSVLLVPLAFSAVSCVFFFALILSDMLRRIARVQQGGTAVTTASLTPDERAPVLRSLVVLPNDYGVLCLTMLLLPLQLTFGIVYSILLVANVGFLLIGCLRWFAEMGGL
ncbi:CDP-alcohol phosphatidyltransferase family protein [uncultured Jatrophihabitans sp.]|uniref:CDP-alcohol phosphatidyltransferase family protein n=1 Tax=uncultured Jatrophihabitans sp. TaxID=1610747 RepID=UPI0035CC24E1